jgi:hypothetical protein
VRPPAGIRLAPAEATSVVRDDIATVIAIAAMAACTSDIAHEAIGHGSACLLSGGQITLLNNAFFNCSHFGHYVAVSGPLGNLAAGLIAFLALRAILARRPGLRLYALLVMSFSLFWEAGYLIQAMIKDSGDSVFAYRELIGPENATVRIAAVTIGIAAYFLFARMLTFGASVFAEAPGRVASLLRPAWITGVVTMALAACLFVPNRWGAMHDAALSIAASFPLLFSRRATHKPAEFAPPIARNNAVITLGALVFVVFALRMGRGVAF